VLLLLLLLVLLRRLLLGLPVSLLKSMSLPIDAIISPGWARSLKRFAGGTTVHYWLNTKEQKLGNGIKADPISAAEAEFIRETFKRVDVLTGLSLVEKQRRGPSEIDFYKVPRYKSRSLIGQTTKRKSWFEITWKDRNGKDMNSSEKSTIVHEIGHALGLDHPYQRPWSPRYTTKDTIMSYNETSNTNFTKTDLTALQSLWGAA